MNINNVNRSLAVYQNSVPTKSVSRPKRALNGGNDSMILSETAKDFKVASEAVKDSPDVRLDKVAKLKEQIAAGTYTINFEDISESILKKNFDAFSF